MNRRRRLLSNALGLASLGACIGLVDAGTATADAVTVITGSIPASSQPQAAGATAGTALVTAFIQPQGAVGVGSTINMVSAATTQSAAGSAFNLSIPHSSAISSLADSSGNLNIVVATTIDGVTLDTFGVVGYNPPASPDGAEAPTTLNMGSLTQLQAITSTDSSRARTDTASPDLTQKYCVTFHVLSTTNDVQTRIGELHTANAKVQGTYQYHTEADSTFSVGASGNSHGLTADGTHSVSNSTGVTASASSPGNGAYRQYIDAHYTYQHLEIDLSKGSEPYRCEYTDYYEATSWDADVYAGPNQAPTNPYGSCHADPHPYVEVSPRGAWSSDRGTAQDYDGSASAFGFSFSDHTGFSNDNHMEFTNGGTTNTFLCGNTADPASAGIIWDSGN